MSRIISVDISHTPFNRRRSNYKAGSSDIPPTVHGFKLGSSGVGRVPGACGARDVVGVYKYPTKHARVEVFSSEPTRVEERNFLIPNSVIR